MAAYGWRKADSVVQGLLAEGYRFDFFQAVRLLEMLHPERVPVGEGPDPDREAVRFRSSVSLGFPPTWIDRIQDPERPEMSVNFLGLGGALGPLPYWVTELLLDRLKEKDTALRDFLDIFNHRLVSIAYRIRRQHRVGIEWRSPEKHGFARYLFSFLGLHADGLRERMKIPDRALLRYAGLLAGARSMAGLLTLLKDFFGIEVEARQFCGYFLDVDDDSRTAIGLTGQKQRLGQGTMLGGRVFAQQAGFELLIGPVDWIEYLEFLPGSKGCTALCQLIRFYVGPNVDFSLRLLLRKEEIQPSPLSSEGEPSAENPLGAPRLGLTSWLTGSGPAELVEVRVADIPRFRDAPVPALPPGSRASGDTQVSA